MTGRPVVPVGRPEGILTAEHRQAVLEGAAGHAADVARRDIDVDDLGRRADAYFDDDYPPTLVGYMQAMMRESWLDDAGSYAKWDKVARAGGVYSIGKVIL